MITEQEKTVINDICKRFFVDKEEIYCLEHKWTAKIVFENNKKIIDNVYDFERRIYFIIRQFIMAELNEKYKWEYHWGDDLENFIRNNPYFILFVKQYKIDLELKKIKTDFE